MDNFQIPRYQVKVVLYRPHAPILEGQIFLSTISEHHPGPQKPSELWQAEKFVAFADLAGVFQVLNNTHIMALSVHSSAQLGDLQLAPEDLLGEFSQKHDLTVTMSDQQTFKGTLIYIQPRSAQRLIDVMNATDKTILLRDRETIHILNKSHISTLQSIRS